MKIMGEEKGVEWKKGVDWCMGRVDGTCAYECAHGKVSSLFKIS